MYHYYLNNLQYEINSLGTNSIISIKPISSQTSKAQSQQLIFFISFIQNPKLIYIPKAQKGKLHFSTLKFTSIYRFFFSFFFSCTIKTHDRPQINYFVTLKLLPFGLLLNIMKFSFKNPFYSSTIYLERERGKLVFQY